MKRDVDLVLAILEQAERLSAEGFFSVEGYPKDDVERHKELLFEAGYLVRRYVNAHTASESLPNMTLRGVQVLGLLRAGWPRVKKGLAASHISSPPLDLVISLCEAALEGTGWCAGIAATEENQPDSGSQTILGKKVVLAARGIDGVRTYQLEGGGGYRLIPL